MNGPASATLRPWFTRADGILIVLLLTSSVAGWFAAARSSEHHWQCRVRVLGNPPSELLFSSIPDQPRHVLGRLGTSTLEWNIHGQVRFASSPCPNHVCMHAGWTSPPFNVVCVPNGVLVEFTATQPDRLDGISR